MVLAGRSSGGRAGALLPHLKRVSPSRPCHQASWQEGRPPQVHLSWRQSAPWHCCSTQRMPPDFYFIRRNRTVGRCGVATARSGLCSCVALKGGIDASAAWAGRLCLWLQGVEARSHCMLQPRASCPRGPGTPLGCTVLGMTGGILTPSGSGARPSPQHLSLVCLPGKQTEASHPLTHGRAPLPVWPVQLRQQGRLQAKETHADPLR